ncbi:aldolase [Sphaerochaeta sp. PS]|uniref:class II aldolase/adducin family protein n=1 Tax=Sphaerochaeta sp. PS TaxID=3076336 RepID=UPI0028A31DC7|nr:aldolase [Sphaerochaeta sp. PS]MDT4762204.1 aldolase [Sphaerochaeta sp. PS]
MHEKEARRSLVMVARSLFARGYAVGSAGNISMRLEDGTYLATPSGSSFGTISEEDIAHFDEERNLLSGKSPTKEVPLHLACYATHPSMRAVVHLHATYSTLLASCEGLTDGLPFDPFTPYFVMRVGEVGVLPYRIPGSVLLAKDIEQRPQFTTYLMANHGMLVCGHTLTEAVNAAEEFEESAKLWYLGQSLPLRYLKPEEIEELKAKR